MSIKIRPWMFALSLALSSVAQQAIALDDPFPGSLFPTDKSTDNAPLFPDDKTPDSSAAKPKVDTAEIKKEMKARVDRADEQMRSQIQKVAQWLQEFSMRNQNRFPGVYGDSNTIERASEVQLTELVGPNPYVGAQGSINAGELDGLSPGLANFYNSDGTPVAGSQIANDEWTSELTADNAGRIQLQMDQSAARTTLNSYRTDPPLNWQAAPGTIVGSGNGQGFLYVWGAGIDGKPVKDYNGSVYIVEAQTGSNVNDPNQEAGY